MGFNSPSENGREAQHKAQNKPTLYMRFLWFFLHTKLSLAHKNWVLDWLFDCSVKWLIWFLFPIVYVNVRKGTFTIWSIWETHTDVIWNWNVSEKNTVHMWRPHHFNIKLSFLQAAWSCWSLSGWNFAVPQQPVFERRSSRVTALCIAEQSCNVSWASNWLH